MIFLRKDIGTPELLKKVVGKIEESRWATSNRIHCTVIQTFPNLNVNVTSRYTNRLTNILIIVVQ